MTEKMAEQEKLLEHKTREIEQLMVSKKKKKKKIVIGVCTCMHSLLQATAQQANAERTRLQGQVQLLADARDENDTLKQQVEELVAAQQALKAAQSAAAAVKNEDSARYKAMEAEAEKVQKEAAQEKAALQAQHREEVVGLRKEMEATREEGLRELEEERKAQVLACSRLKDQIKSLALQLEAEEASKKVRGERERGGGGGGERKRERRILNPFFPGFDGGVGASEQGHSQRPGSSGGAPQQRC